MRNMPEAHEGNKDHAVADAALESVAAEVQTQQSRDKRASNGSPADQKIADLERQLREANERALRANAELDNYRKRSQRELAEERRYAIVPLVHDLLPVVDNLERAIDATQARSASEGNMASLASDVSSLLDGVKLVATQLESVLKQHQCVRIETVGSAFDPNQHQALAQEASDEHPAGTVSRAVQAGYKLHDRVIRPAQVFVSTGPTK
jgi:molecular chaperone GrpE